MKMITLSFQLGPGEMYRVRLKNPSKVLLIAEGSLSISHRDVWKWERSAHIGADRYPFQLPGLVTGSFYVWNSPSSTETIAGSVVIVEEGS